MTPACATCRRYGFAADEPCAHQRVEMTDRERLTWALRRLTHDQELVWHCARIIRLDNYRFRVDIAMRPTSLEETIEFLNLDDEPIPSTLPTGQATW